MATNGRDGRRAESDAGQGGGKQRAHEFPLGTALGLVVLLAAIGLGTFAFGLAAPGPPAATDAGVGTVSPSHDQFNRALGTAAQILPAAPGELGTILLRLVLAGLIGGAISFRGSRRRNEFQIVHTNIIIAFTGAMMMIIVGSDLARAFGLVGASSIVRYRTPVHDPRALASLFVSMGAGIAVGVGLYELAITAAILVILIEVVLERGGGWLSQGWYRPERAYELEVETDTPEETLDAVRRLFASERISHVLVDYDRGKKSETVKMALAIGLPDRSDTEKLTLQILNAGARSVSWRLAKE